MDISQKQRLVYITSCNDDGADGAIMAQEAEWSKDAKKVKNLPPDRAQGQKIVRYDTER